MKRLAALVFLVACERSGPVEATPGSSNTTAETPKAIVVDSGVSDSAKVASIDAAAADASYTDEELVAMANLMTVEGGSGTAGDMNTRRPGTDLGRQIDDARKRGTSGANPPGRVSILKKEAFDDTSLTPDAVLAKMRAAYMAGIKRCYKSYLMKDPSARGKVKLTFTVNETGRSVSPKAAGFAKEIDACLAGVMASWRFPIPKDVDGEATDAAFGFELQLVPD